MTCSYCERDDYCGSTISPRMCERHFGLILVGLHLVRHGAAVTAGSVKLALRKMTPAQRLAAKIEESQVKELLAQLEQGGYVFPQPWRRIVAVKVVIGEVGEVGDGKDLCD